MSELALNNTQAVSVFSDATAFEQAQRMVAPLAKSTMVPAAYQNNIPNCMVALEMSYRLGRSVLMVMQNTDVIYGKPTLGSSFVISLINASGLFSEPLDFVFDNEEAPTSCYATTKRANGGKVLRGTTITIAMAKSEGWWDKKGSKWPNMTGQMLMYRAAAFFGRVHCPDVLNGMQTIDEVIDVGYVEETKGSPSVEKFNATVSQAADPAETTSFEEVPANEKTDLVETTETIQNADVVSFEEVDNGQPKTAEAPTEFTPAAAAENLEEDEDF